MTADLEALLARAADLAAPSALDLDRAQVQATHRRRRRVAVGAVAAGAGCLLAVGVVASALPGAHRADGPVTGRVVQRGGPELGRVAAPPGLRSAGLAPPAQVDLLASYDDGGTTVGTYGWVDGGTFCWSRFVTRPSPGQTSPEPGTCGPLDQDLDRLAVSRSLGLVSGGVPKQVLWGFAPTGTAQVRLTGDGRQVTVPAYDAGPAWRDTLHFAATWPAGAAVTATALDARGTELARTSLGLPAGETLEAPRASRLARTDEFGRVARVARQSDGTYRVWVDRVDWLTGAQARADGTDGGDYDMRNTSPRLRQYVVGPQTQVFGSIRLLRQVEPARTTLAAWLAFVQGPDREAVAGTYFHLQVAQGRVVGIEEQYRP